MSTRALDRLYLGKVEGHRGCFESRGPVSGIETEKEPFRSTEEARLGAKVERLRRENMPLRREHENHTKGYTEGMKEHDEHGACSSLSPAESGWINR